MYSIERDDIIGFSYGREGEVCDSEVDESASNYISMHDDVSNKLKELYYAVVLHGWVDSVEPATKEHIFFTASQLASRIRPHWQMKGKNRAILLLSCFTGLGFSKHLCRELRLPVVAPRSSARVNKLGGIISESADESVRTPFKIVMSGGYPVPMQAHDYYVPDRPDWVFNHPNGNIKIIKGGSYLDKEEAIRLARSYIITI